jgi:voltage-dependent calcium channel L type alpha-1D
VAVIFLVDQFIKLIGQGLMLFLSDYENALYSLTSVGSIINIAMTGGNASPITVFTLLKLFKVIRRSNLYQVYDQLTDSIILTLSVILSYCAIMVLFVYIFALLGMQFFAGRLYFDDEGYYDPINGKVPRMNFDTITWSVTTVLTCLIGDDWSYIMFNCMMATGWVASFYFILMIIFG